MSNKKILVIVESPGKIKKLQSILGDNYIVMASVGHLIDLDPKKLSVDIENNFEPTYQIISDSKSKINKKNIVSDLKKAAKNASDVLLAADQDREGEMIAWSIATVLNLDIKKAKRIVFKSITKEEILNAVKNSTKIDMNLVNAQKARRILDRIIGFEISPILWKNIGSGSLSAGRVQSVVTRLLIDRENEIKNFLQDNNNQAYFDFKGEFESITNCDLIEFKKTKYEKAKINGESNAKLLMKNLIKYKYKIDNIIEKDSFRQPSPPFTTSTLVQEAARKLGFTIKRTNYAAQKLYEAGHITYMRTDSVNLSKEALDNIKKFIEKKYGKDSNKYYRYLNYSPPKNGNTQEAHEACRPTDVNVENINSSESDEIKLYNLIWKRTVASQMQPAKIKFTDLIIKAEENLNYGFLSQFNNLIFDGFLSIYGMISENEENEENGENGENEENKKDINSDLKKINIPKIGTKINLSNLISEQKYNKPPSRYNEASLINKLDPKNLNIGRPATYGPIINTIIERKYVNIGDIEGIEKDSIYICWDNKNNKIKEKINKIRIGKESNKIIPTSLGIVVTDFLIKNFNDIVDYKYTASMEVLLDDIAEGKKEWVKVLDTFYKKFHPIVENLLKSKTTIISDSKKLLGIHPETKDEIYISFAKYGDVLIMNGNYAPIKPPLTKENITIDDAVKIFEYPKDLGKYDRKIVLLNRGKYGLYITIGKGKSKETISLNNTDLDEKNITLEKILDLIKEKSKKILKKITHNNITYNLLEGPYGKYFSINDLNKKKKTNISASTLSDKEIEDLTSENIENTIKDIKSKSFKKLPPKVKRNIKNKKK